MTETNEHIEDIIVLKKKLAELSEENQQLKQEVESLSSLEVALRKSEERFFILLDHLPGVAYLCKNDERFTMLLLSDEVERLTGYSRQDFLSDKISFVDLYHPEDADRISPIVDTKIAEKSRFNIVYRIKRRDGRWRWIEESGSGIFENNKLVMLEGYLTDITDRIQVDMELKRHNRELHLAKEKAEASSRLKTKFLNNLSHEIRTPMNSIVGFSDLLLDENLASDTKKRYVQIIQKSCKNLLGSINDIMDISSLDTRQVVVRPVYFSLFQFMQEHLKKHMLEASVKNLKFVLDNEGEDGAVMVTDRVILSRILSCLIENAVKFTRIGQVNIGYEINEQTYRIYVQDSGVGIQEEMKEKIFERFTQDVYEGTVEDGLGLGLSLAREYAVELGASLTVESRFGQGSTFTIQFPSGNGLSK